MVGGMPADHRDAGGVVAGLVIGRPIDRAALQKPEPYPVPLEDHRSPRCRPVRPGPGMRDPDFVQAGDGPGNCRLAIIDIIGDADRMNPGRLEPLAGYRGIGIKPLVLDRMAVRWPIRDSIPVS